jgi:RNA polymerase sigma-70 factor (ECF subfamily)
MPMSHDPGFSAAFEPLRGALRNHCYRMLGSSHDSDDVVQETLLRAWRARDGLRDPAMLRPWLYRIATNVCLDELARRPRRVLSRDAYPRAADPRAQVLPPIDEPIWLEPMPSTWLEDEAAADPAAQYTLKESVALAFVAALQCLSPPQRAALLLRDVVGLSAEETASALGISVSAANSALFRARAAIEEKLGARGAASFAENAGPVDEALLARYVRAFEAGDVDDLVAVLHDEVKTTMPPSPMWIDGRAANEAFYRTMFPTPRPGRIRHVRTSANGHSALGFYRPASEGAPRTLHAIQVVTARSGRIATIDHFMMRAVFPVFGLPAEV